MSVMDLKFGGLTIGALCCQACPAAAVCARQISRHSSTFAHDQILRNVCKAVAISCQSSTFAHDQILQNVRKAVAKQWHTVAAPFNGAECRARPTALATQAMQPRACSSPSPTFTLGRLQAGQHPCYIGAQYSGARWFEAHHVIVQQGGRGALSYAG